MKFVSWVGSVAVMCIAGAAVAGTPTTPKGHVVEDFPLQAFFHASHAWRVKIYATSDKGSDYAANPVYVCFIERGANQRLPPHGRPSPDTHCSTLGTGMHEMRSFTSARLQMLPGTKGGDARPSLVIHAGWSGGGSGFLQGVYVFNYIPNTDQFEQTFHSTIVDNGVQQFVGKGPLAGMFVTADQVYVGNEPNMAVPLHYEIDVYEPAPRGYVRVLGMATRKRYPSFRSGDMLRDPIAKFTPEISRAIKTIYASDVAAVEK